MNVTLFLGAGFSAAFGHPVMDSFLGFADGCPRLNDDDRGFAPLPYNAVQRRTCDPAPAYSEVDHETLRPVSVLPPASLRVAESWIVDPSSTSAVEGETVTEATGAGGAVESPPQAAEIAAASRRLGTES